MARLKLDENMPDSSVEILRSARHDFALARDEGLAGLDDVRLHRQTLGWVRRAVMAIGDLLLTEAIAGKLWIVDESRVRVWPER